MDALGEDLMNARELDDIHSVLQAVQRSGYVLTGLSEPWRSDPVVVRAAVARTPRVVAFVQSPQLLDDRDLILGAVAGYGGTIRFASERLRDDADVALQAVRWSGALLTYVSERLRGDRTIVEAAVGNNGFALQFASTELCADTDLALVALTTTPAAWRFVHPRVRRHWEVRAVVAETPAHVARLMASIRASVDGHDAEDLECADRAVAHVARRFSDDPVVVQMAEETSAALHAPRHPDDSWTPAHARDRAAVRDWWWGS
jgi:hypothetical protein